mgnify:CR=1 FL=1
MRSYYPLIWIRFRIPGERLAAYGSGQARRGAPVGRRSPCGSPCRPGLNPPGDVEELWPSTGAVPLPMPGHGIFAGYRSAAAQRRTCCRRPSVHSSAPCVRATLGRAPPGRSSSRASAARILLSSSGRGPAAPAPARRAGGRRGARGGARHERHRQRPRRPRQAPQAGRPAAAYCRILRAAYSGSRRDRVRPLVHRRVEQLAGRQAREAAGPDRLRLH